MLTEEISGKETDNLPAQSDSDGTEEMERRGPVLISDPFALPMNV